MFTGLIAVPAACLGEIIGGLIVKRYNMNLKQVLKLSIVFSFLSLALAPIYLAKCPNANLAGVTTGYTR